MSLSTLRTCHKIDRSRQVGQELVFVLSGDAVTFSILIPLSECHNSSCTRGKCHKSTCLEKQEISLQK